MAHYVRFEIYVPVIYTEMVSIKDTDEQSQEEEVRKSLDPDLVWDFINETIDRFGGITQANPVGPVPYRGFWRSTKIVIDRLTYLFGLVAIDQEDEAVEHFSQWKKSFEESTNQDVVLVFYYPVQVIGNL